MPRPAGVSSGERLVAERSQLRTTDSIDAWWTRLWRRTERGDSLDIAVYVRSFSPPPGGHAQRRELFETLSLAAAEEIVDSRDVTLLGPKLCLCQNCQQGYEETGHLRTVRELGSFEKRGLESCGFRTRQIASPITGEEYRVIVPPETAVALSVDETLTGVFPCRAGGKSYGVDAFLADFRATFDLADQDTAAGPTAHQPGHHRRG